MKVLITGATSAIGSSLLPLLRQQADVTTLSRSVADNANHVSADITDKQAVAAAVNRIKPEIIIHLAGIAGEANCQKDPELTRTLNLVATVDLASAAKQAGTNRFIFASTSAVYTQTLDQFLPVTEGAHLKPRGLYGRFKAEAEAALQNLSDDSFSVISLRIFNVYGPGCKDSLVNKLEASDSAHPQTITDPDHYFRDYIHVKELSQVFLRACDCEVHGFEAINIGSGVATSTMSLIQQLRGLGFYPHYSVSSVKAEIFSWADIAKARSSLMFTPSQEIQYDKS